MNRVDEPLLFPACCLLCRSAERSGYIDRLGMNVIGERLYICVECILDMGRKIGMLGPQEIAAAEEAGELLDEISAERDQLQEELNMIRGAVRHTLEAGAVWDKEEGTATLRSKPGKKKVKVA